MPDDLAYVKIAELVKPFSFKSDIFFTNRDYIWYLFLSALKTIFSSNLSLRILSAVGALIKLLVLYRLSNNKMQALVLYFSLIYIQFDLTQLRSGFALSWLFAAIYFLVKQRFIVACLLLGTNFLVHKQAIFSSLVCIVYKNKTKYYIVFVSIVFLFIAVGLYPNRAIFLVLGDLGLNHNIVTMDFINERLISIKFIVIIVYSIYLSINMRNNPEPIFSISISFLVLALFLTWLFASMSDVQTRMNDFYISTIVFLTAYANRSSIFTFSTICISVFLYFRLEFLHSWING